MIDHPLFIKSILGFFALLGFGALCLLGWYVVYCKECKKRMRGTVEPSPWKDYKPKETKP